MACVRDTAREKCRKSRDDEQLTNTINRGQILVVTVGLPGRGKTHLAHSIQRYLRWMGVQCRVYNLANMRRSMLGPLNQLPGDYFGNVQHDTETKMMRLNVMERLESTIRQFFEQGGQVAVYDANNSNHERRCLIQEEFGKMGVQVLFIGTYRATLLGLV